MSKSELTDKVIAVTGAGGGIGRAAALLAASNGARLALTDISEDSLEVTARLAREAGSEVIAESADLTSTEAVDSLFSDIVEHFGRLDGAFNNAGVSGGQLGQDGRFVADWDEAAFDTAVEVNLKGVWRCLRSELRQMSIQDSGGSIVNTASLAGLKGFLCTAGYSASKHGVVGLTKTAAIEYGPLVRVNAVCPGYTDTDLMKDAKSRLGDALVEAIPAKRLARPDDIAQMVCWLLSDRASYASGGEFVVDGGLMAG